MLWELPPRARRILFAVIVKLVIVGTTSACAENTRRHLIIFNRPWNYLRVRGEYFNMLMILMVFLELPPRARRIQRHYFQAAGKPGTTSACAENTPIYLAEYRAPGNYLRVRGEYPFDWAIGRAPWELPPRARRIHGWHVTVQSDGGTTSACAENTLNELGLL